jgi:hypothetical protein
MRQSIPQTKAYKYKPKNALFSHVKTEYGTYHYNGCKIQKTAVFLRSGAIDAYEGYRARLRCLVPVRRFSLLALCCTMIVEHYNR